MQLMTIENADHSVLREPAKALTFPLSAETQQFIQEFLAFFQTLPNPAGLAAPQVGVGLQVIVFQVSEAAKLYRKNVVEAIPPTLFINPSYTRVSSDKTRDWEGCFSVPDLMGEVCRYDVIDYVAYDLEGNKISGRAQGFFARVLQHEIGHLNGELYTDLFDEESRVGTREEILALRQASLEVKRE